MAVTLLATALCADRAATAAAASQPNRVTSEETASRGFAQRLTVSLRRVVPAIRFQPSRQEGAAPQAWQVARPAPQTLGAVGREGQPFEFRLPPPLA